MELTLTQHLERPAFMVICDGECDQICGSRAEAERERKDLKRMGYWRVTIKDFASWKDAHDYEDKLHTTDNDPNRDAKGNWIGTVQNENGWTP